MSCAPVRTELPLKVLMGVILLHLLSLKAEQGVVLGQPELMALLVLPLLVALV
jgi:hypothetical protein